MLLDSTSYVSRSVFSVLSVVHFRIDQLFRSVQPIPDRPELAGQVAVEFPAPQATSLLHAVPAVLQCGPLFRVDRQQCLVLGFVFQFAVGSVMLLFEFATKLQERLKTTSNIEYTETSEHRRLVCTECTCM